MSLRWFDIVSGARRGPAAAAVRATLSALSIPYSAAVGGRRLMYRSGLIRRVRAPVPVVSVGNITVGGTGKTPLVEHLARSLLDAGRRPAVVMRGYGARHDSLGSGDEAAVLRANMGRVPVIENPSRASGAQTAFERDGCDVVILDDGFQHIALERDLDIVAIDATLPFGHGRLLPRGLLREPLSALQRADVLVVTRSDLVDGEYLVDLAGRLRSLAPGALMCATTYEPMRLVPKAGGEPAPVGTLRGARVAVFCGIGNPGAFRASVERAGAEVVLTRAFPDHHAFSREEVSEVADSAGASGAEMVVTTQKDSVRFDAVWWPAGAPDLHILRSEIRFLPAAGLLGGEEDYASAVMAALDATQTARRPVAGPPPDEKA